MNNRDHHGRFLDHSGHFPSLFFILNPKAPERHIVARRRRKFKGFREEVRLEILSLWITKTYGMVSGKTI